MEQGGLRHVVVIPSEKSLAQWDAFEELVRAWFPAADFTLEKACGAVDYFDPEVIWKTADEQ